MESGVRPELCEGRDPQALPPSYEPWSADTPSAQELEIGRGASTLPPQDTIFRGDHSGSQKYFWLKLTSTEQKL